MNKVIIMRSPPGGGKSTFVRQLVQNAEYDGYSLAVHSTDDFFVMNGVYAFNETLLHKYHVQNFNYFKNSLKNKINIIIVDNTNIYSRDYKPYVEEAEGCGYSVEFREFSVDFGFDVFGKVLSLDDLVNRVSERAKKDISSANPPAEKIKQMYDSYRPIRSDINLCEKLNQIFSSVNH